DAFVSVDEAADDAAGSELNSASFVGGGVVDGDRVVAREAGGAQLAGLLLGGGDHAVQGDVAQGIRAEVVADLVRGQSVGDEFGTSGEVDAVEAGPFDRRRGDAHVDLLRPG